MATPTSCLRSSPHGSAPTSAAPVPTSRSRSNPWNQATRCDPSETRPAPTNHRPLEISAPHRASHWCKSIPDIGADNPWSRDMPCTCNKEAEYRGLTSYLRPSRCSQACQNLLKLSSHLIRTGILPTVWSPATCRRAVTETIRGLEKRPWAISDPLHARSSFHFQGTCRDTFGIIFPCFAEVRLAQQCGKLEEVAASFRRVSCFAKPAAPRHRLDVGEGQPKGRDILSSRGSRKDDPAACRSDHILLVPVHAPFKFQPKLSHVQTNCLKVPGGLPGNNAARVPGKCTWPAAGFARVARPLPPHFATGDVAVNGTTP